MPKGWQRKEKTPMEISELERIAKQRERLLTKGLNTRQHRLKDWLKENFISGHYFTIEEICEAGLGYKLNTNPYTHDKCAVLGADVRAINWLAGYKRYIPIIKNDKGSIKLAESKQEVDEYIKKEKSKVEKHYQYYNHLASLSQVDGMIPFINQANRALEDNEIKPVEVFKR